MGWYNRLVGSPKWAYEGIKGEIVSVTSGIAGAIGGTGDYVVDSVSDIALGTGGAIEDIGGNIGKGIGSELIEYPVTAVTAPSRTIRKGSYFTAINCGRILFIKKIKEKNMKLSKIARTRLRMMSGAEKKAIISSAKKLELAGIISAKKTDMIARNYR